MAASIVIYRHVGGTKLGLAPDTTMADLASHYATAIEDRFEGAIHILGFSTGGSIAQQFAADRPELVRRLVLAGTACRHGPVAREPNPMAFCHENAYASLGFKGLLERRDRRPQRSSGARG